MSTRSNIKLIDNCGEILLYKHHDGYPETQVPFLVSWLEKSGKSAEWMAKQMIEETECDVSSGLHGDIEYYYEVEIENDFIGCYKVHRNRESGDQEMERIYPDEKLFQKVVA